MVSIELEWIALNSAAAVVSCTNSKPLSFSAASFRSSRFPFMLFTDVKFDQKSKWDRS